MNESNQDACYTVDDFSIVGLCESCRKEKRVKVVFGVECFYVGKTLMCFNCYERRLRIEENIIQNSSRGGIIYGCPFE